MKSVKFAIGCLVLFSTLNVFAMGHDQDSFFSMYGQNAKKYFNKSTKVTSDCSYIENDIDANGNTVDTVKLVIQGQQINSIECKSIGEQTYACEASTLWSSTPCKAN